MDRKDFNIWSLPVSNNPIMVSDAWVDGAGPESGFVSVSTIVSCKKSHDRVVWSL